MEKSWNLRAAEPHGEASMATEIRCKKRAKHQFVLHILWGRYANINIYLYQPKAKRLAK